MKPKKKLSAYIEKDYSKETRIYKITINGDEFYQETYKDAIRLLINILIRDEL